MKRAKSINHANKMIKSMIDYELRGRTYSDADPQKYTEDYNYIFDKVNARVRKHNLAKECVTVVIG